MHKLGFGFMRLPLLNSNEQTSIDFAALQQMVDTFMDRGFTYFDTAYMYHDGLSEAAVRETLVNRYPREAFTLASKLPLVFLKKSEDMERIFQEQLAKCGVAYFDYYLLHAVNTENLPVCERLCCFDFILDKKKEGKVKHVGLSFHADAHLLEQILMQHPEMEFVQLQLNYLDWEDSVVQSRLCLEVCRRFHKPVVVMEPVRGGSLAKVPSQASAVLQQLNPNYSVASWAIRFAASQEGVMMVLSGMTTLEQMLDNTSFMQNFKPLSGLEQEAVFRVGELIRQATAVACTACRYCVSSCPVGIPIPDYFALYNSAKLNPNDLFSIEEIYYSAKMKEFAPASHCVHCGACAKLCPQKLDVPKYIKDVAHFFEVATEA